MRRIRVHDCDASKNGIKNAELFLLYIVSKPGWPGCSMGCGWHLKFVEGEWSKHGDVRDVSTCFGSRSEAGNVMTLKAGMLRTGLM